MYMWGLRTARLEILEDNVAFDGKIFDDPDGNEGWIELQQPNNSLSAFFCPHINSHRLLVTPHAPEPRRGTVHVQLTPNAKRIARIGWLDFDHFRTKVSVGGTCLISLLETTRP